IASRFWSNPRSAWELDAEERASPGADALGGNNLGPVFEREIHSWRLSSRLWPNFAFSRPRGHGLASLMRPFKRSWNPSCPNRHPGSGFCRVCLLGGVAVLA